MDILEPYSRVTNRHAVVHVPFEVDRGRLGGLWKDGVSQDWIVLLVRCHVHERGSVVVCLSACACARARARVCVCV